MIFVAVILFIILLDASLMFYFIHALLLKSRRKYEYFREYGISRGQYSRSMAAAIEETWIKFRINSPFGYLLDGNAYPAPGFQGRGGKKTIIFCHGINWSRWGMVKYIKPFLSSGWNIIIYDNRAHGLSEGKYPSYGYFEKHDLKAIRDYSRSIFPDTEIAGVFGESMGAATVLQYAKIAENLNFIIADCPYSSLVEELEYQLRRYHIPKFYHRFMLYRMRIVTRLMANFDIDTVRPDEDIMETDVPLLLVHGKSDRYVPSSMSIAMYEKRKDQYRTELFLVDKARHVKSVMVSREKYYDRLKEFINSISPDLID